MRPSAPAWPIAVDAPPRRPSVGALIAVSMLSPFAINVIVPSMPAIQADFGASYARVQLVLSLYLAAVALAQIAIGPLSDRYGRRPVLLAGLAVFTLASFACIVAPDVESLIVLRVIQGAGGCAGIVLGRAIIRDLYDRAQAASMIGYVTMGLAVAPMMAPLVGGLLQGAFDWHAIFWFMGAFGLVCLLVAWLDISETHRERGGRFAFDTLARDFGLLLGTPAFVLFTASAALTAGSFFAFLGGAPYVSEVILGLTPTVYGSWFALAACGYLVGSFLSGRFAERVGVARMILAGSLITLPAVAVMAGAFAGGFVSPAALFLPIGVVGMANGLVLPSALAGAISVRPEIAGAASGLTGAVQIGAGAVLSAIAGALLAGSDSAMPLFALMAASGALALAVAVAIVRARP